MCVRLQNSKSPFIDLTSQLLRVENYYKQLENKFKQRIFLVPITDSNQKVNAHSLQGSIPVGCVPPVCCPYMWWSPLGVSNRGVCTYPGHAHPLEISTLPEKDLVPEFPTPWKGHGIRDTHPHPPMDRMTDRHL